MVLTEKEKRKAWEALNGNTSLSMAEVQQMEGKMSPRDREVFHNLMYGKTQKSPEDVYDLLKRNTVDNNIYEKYANSREECEAMGGVWVNTHYRDRARVIVKGYCREMITKRRR